MMVIFFQFIISVWRWALRLLDLGAKKCRYTTEYVEVYSNYCSLKG